MTAWNKDNEGVGEQLPTTDVATITLDQAIVWPSGSPTQIGLATWTADEAQAYSGGQINGCNGDVVSSTGCLNPLNEVLQIMRPSTTSFVDRTPTAGTRPPSPIPSTTPVFLEKGRRCESSPNNPAGRPRGRPWWIPFSDATRHAVRTPPPLPGWLPAGGTDSNVTEEETRHDQPERPANNADLHMGNVGEVSIMPLVRSSEYDTVASTPGSAVPESTPPPPAYIKSALPTGIAHEPSLQLPPDGLNSTGGARSTEHRQTAFSLPEQPAAPLAKQPALQLRVGKTMPLMTAWNKDNGGVGEQVPSTDVATITLDQAIVWPSGSPTQIGLAAGTADEAETYGGGKITGCNGDVVLSAGCLKPLNEILQKPAPSRISFADKTPPSGTRSVSPTQPTTPVSPEEGQCCEGSPSHAAGRPRGRSWWIPFSDVIGHAVRTPPPLPGWRPAGGVGAILKEGEGSHDQYGPPAGNADLHMGDADEVFIMSPAPAIKNDTVASPLGTTLPEYVPTPSAPVKSILSTIIAHGASMQLSLDGLGSADVVRSTELLNAACSLTEQPESSVAMQPALHLAVGKAMASLVGWERVTGGIGGQLPTIEEETDTLDEAIVCPSRGSTDIDLATETADEAHVYGGGQIIGCNGAAILSAPPLALPLEEPLTPSPGRRRAPLGTPPSATPSSSAATSPSAHSSPRRRRRREGSTSPAGRPRNLSRSVSPSDTRSAINTPPFSPDRLRACTVAAELADDGNRQGPPLLSVSEAVRSRNDTGHSDHDDTQSAPGSSIEVGRVSVSTVSASGDTNAGMLLRPTKEESSRDNSLRLLGESSGDTGGVGSVSHRGSEVDAPQAPAWSICQSSTYLSDASLNDVGLTSADSKDGGIGLPLVDSQESVERIAFQCWLEDLESFDAAPPPELRSVGNGDRHSEGATLDFAARHASDEDSRQKPRFNPSAGVEEFKWSGLPNNNIG